MKTQLILLDTPIIVSDEKFEKKDLICFVDLENNFVVEVCKNIDNYNIDTKKIISGLPELPSIDFNGFEEQLGIIDVKKLAHNFVSKLFIKNTSDEIKYGFIKGFKAAQELNKNKFSRNDLMETFYQGQDGRYTSFENFFNDLTQPKVFDVEVEIEKCFNGEPKGEMEFFERPKVENNKIKIIKVL